MGCAHPNKLQAHDSRRPVRPRVAGFTLPELLVVVATVGVLAGLAAPSVSDMVARQRIRGSATDLYLALAKARSEAIKRNTNVTLSPQQVGGNWADGWKILNPSDPTTKLEDHNAINGIVISGPASVEYQSTGRVRGSTAPSFDFSVPGTSIAACVTVDLSGLPVQKSSSC